MQRILVILCSAVLILALHGCADDQLTEPDETTTTLDRTEAAPDAGDVLREAPTDKSRGIRLGATTYEVIIENLTPLTGDGSSQPFSPAIQSSSSVAPRQIRRAYTDAARSSLQRNPRNHVLVRRRFHPTARL